MLTARTIAAAAALLILPTVASAQPKAPAKNIVETAVAAGSFSGK